MTSLLGFHKWKFSSDAPLHAAADVQSCTKPEQKYSTRRWTIPTCEEIPDSGTIPGFPMPGIMIRNVNAGEVEAYRLDL